MRTVIFIQARANSVRLPGKHVADLCGKPLIARVIELCLSTGFPTVVSTNDKEIIGIAQTYKHLAFILERPDYLCDEGRWDDAVENRNAIHDYHVAEWLARNPKDIDKQIRHVTANGDTLIFDRDIVFRGVAVSYNTGAEVVQSAYKAVHEHPAHMVEVDKEGIARPHAEAGPTGGINSREFRPLYVFDGAVAIRHWPLQGEPTMRIVESNKYDSVSIHTDEDLEFARALWTVKQGRKHASYAPAAH